MQGPPQTALGVAVIIGSLLAAVALFAFAELLQLSIDMAADMRATAEYFRRRAVTHQPAQPERTRNRQG